MIGLLFFRFDAGFLITGNPGRVASGDCSPEATRPGFPMTRVEV